MNFDEVLKDRKTWIVAGGAGLVGLVVFLKRGGSNTPAQPSAASGVPATGGMVTADTTSTDIASYLAQVQQQNQDQFNQWGQNLSDTLKAIQNAGTSMTGNTPPTPAQVPQQTTGAIYANVLPGWHVDEEILNLQKGYGPGGAATGITWDKLVQLNPGLSQKISWQPGTAAYPGSKNNVFNGNYNLRVA